MAEQNYTVSFSEHSEMHYAKVFEKKYHDAWCKTKNSIHDICARIDNMLHYKRADLICSEGQYKLVKLDFAVQGAKVSPKASGNRCILFVDEEYRTVEVLLIYGKTQIGPPNETVKWKAAVKKVFPEIAEVFGL